jgi:hypothetical protein
VETNSPAKIFVRACNVHGNTVAFVRPILGIYKHAIAEWEQYRDAQTLKPVTLRSCTSYPERFELLARAVARHHQATLLSQNADTIEAAMVNNRGRYYSIDDLDLYLDHMLDDTTRLDTDLLQGEHPWLSEIAISSVFDVNT